MHESSLSIMMIVFNHHPFGLKNRRTLSRFFLKEVLKIIAERTLLAPHDSHCLESNKNHSNISKKK